jgi:hypothetical protein
MSKTGLQGPYPLSFDAIDSVVRATSAGVYALGHTDAQGRFAINHVGRSDSDLRARLLDCIGSEKLFKYGYSASAQTAFEKECQLFHDFSPPGNRLHPSRPTALCGAVLVAGCLRLRREERDDVGEGGLVAVMPIGALGGVRIEVALVALRVGRLVLEPLPDAVPAPLQ